MQGEEIGIFAIDLFLEIVKFSTKNARYYRRNSFTLY